MMRLRSRTSLVVVTDAIATAAFGRVPTFLRDDEPEERLAMGRIILKNNCLMCHSSEIIASQRLSADQWKAEVVKMVGWGAPIAAEDQPVLLDYLNATHGPDVPRAASPRALKSDGEMALNSRGRVASMGDETRGRALYNPHCASCHGPEAKGIDGGVNLIARPVLDREEDFRTVVRDGRNKMPGFRSVLGPSQEDDVRAWLREISR